MPHKHDHRQGYWKEPWKSCLNGRTVRKREISKEPAREEAGAQNRIIRITEEADID